MYRLRRLGSLFVVALFASLIPIVLSALPATAQIDPLINEVDADTAGIDTLEFLELFDGGAGNTALDGLVVVFYNGNGDTVYDAIDLDGFATNADGYFVIGNVDVVPAPDIVIASNGIQNGEDAVALYRADGADFPNATAVTTDGLVDALVYDTNDSDATGLLVLLNTGQAQINENENGDKDFESNQRCPNGSGAARDTDTYAQFAPTPGAENACGVVPAVDPLINEVDADTAGTDTLEFLELFDGGAGNTSLDGLVVVFYNGSDDESYRTVDLAGLSTDADGYFVMGNVGVVPAPDIVIPGNGIQNGQDGVGLYRADVANFPDDTPVTTEGLVDGFVYGTNDSDDPELAVLLNAGQAQINEGGGGDKDFESNQRCPNGSGAARDTDTYAQFAPTPGAANTCDGGPAGDPLINEVDADTAGTDTLEFLELFDGGAGNTALDGLAVVLYNGSDDASYDAFDLDGFTTDADGYFVIGNAGVSPTPDIVIGSNGIQNGQDGVALYRADAADFPMDTPLTTDGLIDGFVYGTNDPDDSGLAPLLNAGQAQINEDENGAKDTESNQRCPNGSGAARDTDSYAQFAPTPGAENTCEAPAIEIGECAAPATLIHDIQGSGAASPLIGQVVVLEGVVVGDFQDEGINTFAVQEEDADADADPLTSEGILVFEGANAVQVAEGDVVRVLGTVTEFGGVTEISPLSQVVVCEALTGTATPAAIDLPVNSVDDLEAYEGMGVVFPEELTVTETFQQARFGEVVLSADGRQFNPTNIAPPAEGVGADDDGDRIIDSLEPGRIILDDLDNGEITYGPTDLPPYVDADGTRRAGDTVTGLTGVLDEAFGQYRIRPVGEVVFASDNPRDAAPDPGGNLTVASFNVLNFFDTVDTGAAICGPTDASGCRGADNATELDRQRTKITAAINAMDADIVGLIEIENNATDAIDLLLSGLPAYTALGTGTIGDDAIKVAFIYKADEVTPVGAHAILDSSVDPRFIDTKSRPALAQTFEHNATGDAVTVVVNHFKSKGSSCSDVGDPTSTSGQGNCNGTRTLAAQALTDWLATDPTSSGDADVLIIGDLNAYAFEDPIVAIEGAGYTDLVEQFVPAADRYSFIFAGASGYLDHALANTSLAPKVAGAEIWHINADEPRFRDYNDDILDAGENPFRSEGDPNPPAAFQPDEFRASDHDPVLIGLNMEATSLRQQLRDFAVELAGLAEGDRNVARAARLVDRSTADRLWDDDNTLSSRGRTVFSLHSRVARILQSPRTDPAITDLARIALFDIDRQIVVDAIDAAIAREGRPRLIAAAMTQLAVADTRAATDHYPGAFRSLRSAWASANRA